MKTARHFVVGAAVVSLFLPVAMSHAQVLTVTNGLQLWLEADAGVTTNTAGGVILWADQSPNGNNGSPTNDASAPLFIADAQNGKPALRFDGLDDVLDIPSNVSIGITGDISSFFVVKFDDFATYRAVWGKTLDNYPAPTDYYVQPGSGVPTVFRGDGSQFQVGGVTGTGHLRSGTYSVVGFEMAGTTVTHYLNGQAAGSGEITAIPGDAGTALKIGSRDDSVTRMKGEIAEVLIYDVALSDTDRDSVINYLKVKYNIINLPPTIVLTGNPAGPNVNPGDLIALTAAATDPDGSVDRVDFFANGQLIGTATASPFSMRVSIETAGTVVFTAVATDDKDATADSLPLTFTVASVSSPPLTATNGLQLWLKADAGVTTGTSGGTTAWADQSGNGNNATQTDENQAPTLVPGALNGQPVLRFDGFDDYLDVASSPSVAITNDIASFFVVRFDNFDTYRAVWGKTFGNVPRPNDYYLLPNSGVPRAYRGSDTDGNDSVDGASRLSTNVAMVLGFNQAGPIFTHHINGAPFGSGRMHVQAGDDGTPLKIGTRDDLFTKMQGDLGELLIYNTALDAAGLKNVFAYLGAKYGIPIVVPTNTPPSATITSPAHEAVFATPTNMTIAVEANDPDGSVVRVDFYVGSGLVASDTSAPFSASVALPPAPGTVTLTAVATDNLGLTSTSSPVAITLAAAQAIPLPSPAHLKLWLRADAGVVTNSGGAVIAWNDQSGSFHNASPTDADAAPQWSANAANGKPALHFDGANDQLAVPYSSELAVTGDLSSFFVIEIDDFATYRGVWTETSGGYPLPNEYYLLPDSVSTPGFPVAYRAGYNGAGFVNGLSAPPTNRFVIAGFETAGTTLTHYLDGQENGSGEITNKIADAGLPLLIGKRDDSATLMKGHIAELVIYDTALSSGDRSAAVRYLANKYGIELGASEPSLTTQFSSGALTLTWPASATNFVLESAGALPPVSWSAVPVDPPPAGQDFTVTVSPTNAATFYRLRGP